MATVQKWGNSLGIRIPRELAEDIGFSEGKQVRFEKSGDALMMRPVKRLHYSLKELLKGVTAKNKHKEVNWGPAQGREVHG